MGEWNSPGRTRNQAVCVCCATFDVLGQGLPCAGVLDTVSTPGGVELDQPGRGRVTDGGLQAAAAQDHQRVLLRVQTGCGSQTPGDEPEDGRRFEPELEHPCRPGRVTPTAGCQRDGEFLPKTSRETRADMRAAAPITATCVYSREQEGDRRLTPTSFWETGNQNVLNTTR